MISVPKLRQMGFSETVADQLVDLTKEGVVQEEAYTVGQRVQFYRKGYAPPGEKEPTLSINGMVKDVCPKTGWLTVEHKWGVAIVRPQEEKVQILQHKKGNKLSAYGAEEV
jgi:hypothetical protein